MTDNKALTLKENIALQIFIARITADSRANLNTLAANSFIGAEEFLKVRNCYKRADKN